jgi:PAS domain S-box-containing protein
VSGAERDVRRLTALRNRLPGETDELRVAAESGQRRYAELFDSAPDAYVVTDRGGRIAEANRTAEQLLGSSRRFLIGKSLGTYLGRDGTFAIALAESSRSLVLTEREMEVLPRDGEPFHVGVTANAVVGVGGKAVEVRWLLRDIGARKRAEEEIRRLNSELEARVRARTSELEAANRAKDELLRELGRRSRVEREFVTNAAHELRTPVTAIMSAVEVLQGGAKEVAAERDRFLAHVEVQCRRLQRLAYSLLVLARAQMTHEAPHVESVRLSPFLREFARSLALPNGTTVRVQCGSSTAVLANRDLLEQALTSVAENAAKYAGDGEIVFAARSLGRSGRVRLEVRDTGPGMTDEQRERAVQRFYRGGDEQGDGFGLGLAIAAEAVGVLGGDLEISSAPGAGTTVAMILRRAA